MSHVFISYSHEDGDYARKYAAELQRRGFDVWMDERIDYGDRWFKEISKAIRECAAFSVIMTPAAEESEWVEREILVAQKHNKLIFPLLLKGREFDLLITTQFAEVSGGKIPEDDFFARLGRVASVGSEAQSTQSYDDTFKAKSEAPLAKEKAIADMLVRRMSAFDKAPERGWEIGQISEIILKATYERGSDQIIGLTEKELSNQEERLLGRHGWRFYDHLGRKDWVISEEPDFLASVAADLIAANEILGIAAEDITITEL